MARLSLACVDFAEIILGTDSRNNADDDCSPTNVIGLDTDGDTCPDILETAIGRNPLDPSDCNIKMFIDRDGDGCSDYVEESFGLDPTNPNDCSPAILKDSDLDGCSDFVEVSIGSDPLNPFDCDCPASKRVDTDKDGLLDCEEEILGFATTLFDTDKDGLLDTVEFMGGSNPVSLDEGYLDTDMDDVNNNTEVREHTNPKHSDGTEREQIAYKYELTNKGQSADQLYCYKFSISNITLLETQADYLGREGINRVLFYIIETPQDVNFANDEGILRVKELVVRYKNGSKFLVADDGRETPLGGTMSFTDADIKAFDIVE